LEFILDKVIKIMDRIKVNVLDKFAKCKLQIVNIRKHAKLFFNVFAFCFGLSIFPRLYADAPSICNGDNFACAISSSATLYNAIPIKLNYRQINFKDNYKIYVKYIPPSGIGYPSDTNNYNYCGGKVSLNGKETPGSLSSALNGYSSDNIFCIRGFVYGNNSMSTTSPGVVNVCGKYGCGGDPDAVNDNLQNTLIPENPYVFNYVDGNNYLSGNESKTYHFPLYYLNSLFLKDTPGSTFQSIRYVPGKNGNGHDTMTYSIDLGSKDMGTFVFYLDNSEKTKIGEIKLTNDGNLYYYKSYAGVPSIKNFSITSSPILSNIALVAGSSIDLAENADEGTDMNEEGLNINVVLACTNPTADQMEPCGTPGVSDSECAIPCDVKNLPTS
jgi:hypothetical protein